LEDALAIDLPALPLKERAAADDSYFCLITAPEARTRTAQPTGLPAPPGPGEQYRFHFDMSKCIGCHCCEVACNEQNGNPAGIQWRRVGEIEGGSYPFTRRFHLSMGCNHCLEPSCLIGCPVDAFTKDRLTGLVLHSSDACIGCQYCTWNCPYGVPQYNSERGVVGKCDMCYGRLNEGLEPACVNACPEGAIQIEVVNIAAWKQDYALHANSPGLPSAEHTISTTRITLPDAIPVAMEKADYHRVRPELPHWPLVFMLVFTQMSVGAFALIWMRQVAGGMDVLRPALAAAASGFVALTASTLHLGRPAHAFRALKMWRRSWLSREALLFTLFSVAAAAYAGALWMGFPGVAALGLLTSVLGILGIVSSACIYLVPARPAWNNGYTIADFFLTGALLGSLLTCVVPWPGMSGVALYAAAAAGAAQLLNQMLKLFMMFRSEDFELRASLQLLSGELKTLLAWRVALLLAGGVLAPLLNQPVVALALALAAEIIGRYLFFVSVAPKNMAAMFAQGAA
jgi:formate dehydrogenase iron-sulfur subunit